MSHGKGRFPVATWPILTVMLAAVASGCDVTVALGDRVEGSFERALKVTDPVDLDVRTGSGDITIQPGVAGEVKDPVASGFRIRGSGFVGLIDRGVRAAAPESRTPNHEPRSRRPFCS